MTKAAIGADVIVNGLNPPHYHNWAKIIPAITQQVISAARASGATVIIPGNIYNFGHRCGELNEATPHEPCSVKGQIRVDMERAYRDAGIPTIILRAGNFLDPNRDGDMQSTLILKSGHKGVVTALGRPDIPQSHAYLPDWARAAQMLADRRDQLATFEDIPFPGHTFSMEDLANQLSAHLGRPVRVKRLGWWILALLSPFWELAREFREMRYLNDMPHWLGSTKFDRLLPDFVPTSPQVAMLAGLEQSTQGGGHGLKPMETQTHDHRATSTQTR